MAKERIVQVGSNFVNIFSSADFASRDHENER